MTNFKVRVDCDVVGIMSRCLNFTSSGANEGVQSAIFDQSEARKVSTLSDSDAYNSQIMAQIVDTQSEDMTSRLKNPMLILARKKI